MVALIGALRRGLHRHRRRGPRTGPRPARGRGASAGGLLGGAPTALLATTVAARDVLIRAVASRHPIPTAVLLGGGLIPVAHAATVLGVVLPLLPAAALDFGPAPVDVLVDVHVVVPTPSAATTVVVVVDVVIIPVAAARDGRADR